MADSQKFFTPSPPSFLQRIRVFFGLILLSLIVILGCFICSVPILIAGFFANVFHSKLAISHLLFYPRLLKNTFWLFLKPLCGVKLNLNIPKSLPKKGIILAGNHQSALETYILPGILPIFPVVKRSIFWFPVLGWMLYFSGAIGLDRSKPSVALRKLLGEAKIVIKKGNILIFPQGTRRTFQHQKPHQKGYAIIAKELGVPIVPFVHNFGDLWPKNFFQKRAGIATLHFGEAILTKDRPLKEIHQDYLQSIQALEANFLVSKEDADES